MNKKKFDIVYKYFAKPVSTMAMTYKKSALTIESGVVSPKVSKCFDALVEALNEQLDKYRK